MHADCVRELLLYAITAAALWLPAVYGQPDDYELSDSIRLYTAGQKVDFMLSDLFVKHVNP